MTKLDWSKAKAPGGKLIMNTELSDSAAEEDRKILGDLAKQRRKLLNKLPANWLKTNKQVRAYKQALKDKSK